jgi:hypothetical protein
MKTAASQAVAAAVACLMIATISALSLTGRWPGGASIARYEPNGIVDLPTEQVRRVELAERGDLIVWRPTSEGWTAEAAGADNAVGDHVETALRFLNVSAPLRVLGAGEFSDADIAEFGLDPPGQMIALVGADGSVTSVWFGALNMAQTSHYSRVVGRSAIYLMPRHVAAEWQLAADMTRRHAPIGAAKGERLPASTALLLPVSLAQIWAVEIVAAGNLQRFERDRAGEWFHHIGEHVHLSSADAHIADPQQGRVIAGELAAFERTPIEGAVPASDNSDVLARTGLARPSLIVLLYARDNSQAVTRIELGEPASDGFHRYARIRDGGNIVTIPSYAAAHLTALLRLVK